MNTELIITHEIKFSRSEGSLLTVWRVDQEQHREQGSPGFGSDEQPGCWGQRLALCVHTVQFLMLHYATELWFECRNHFPSFWLFCANEISSYWISQWEITSVPKYLKRNAACRLPQGVLLIALDLVLSASLGVVQRHCFLVGFYDSLSPPFDSYFVEHLSLISSVLICPNISRIFSLLKYPAISGSKKKKMKTFKS